MPLPSGYKWTPKVNDYLNYDYSYKPPSKEDIDADREDYNASEQMFSEWDFQNEQGLGPQGEALPELAIGWKPTGEADYGTGFKGFWNKAVSNVRSAWKTGYEEGIKISGIVQPVEAMGDLAISKIGGNEALEKVKSVTEKRYAPKDQDTAYWMASLEATKEGFNQALWGALELLGQPAVLAEQAIGTAGQTLGRALGGEEINKETIKRDWDASRLAYSAIFDQSVYAEMNRRLDAGMRADLAAQDIMVGNKNVFWPELIGQLVLDPLNLVTVWTKAGAAMKLEKNVAKTFHEVVNPNIAKMLDDVADASKLDDAQAYQKVQEIVKSQQALVTAASHAEDIAETGKDMVTLSNSYKLGSLTRDGKIAHLANQTGEILMHVVNNSSPDEALEIIRGMVKSVSKNPEEAAEGIAAMLHFADPKSLFSEAGNKTTVMLSKMVEKYGDNWLKNIDSLKGDPVKLTKDLMSKLDSVGEEMFPSVSKMLEAEDLVKAGGEISDATRALADRAAQLPESVKAATRFHDAAQKVVGPINRAFAGAYMGWNPGYAFRNFTNNTAQILIDYGPGVLLGKADDLIGKAERVHGGLLQGQSGFGGQMASLFKVEEKGKGISLTHGPSQILAEKLESNAAKRIIGKTYMNTFEKGTKAMVKALTPELKAAGFSDDIIRKLPTYILQNDGDATKVLNALRTDVSSGVIDIFNNIDRIDPQYKSFLDNVGKWDEYSETVLKASTREEATKAAEKIFNDIAQAGDYVYREGRPAVDNHDKFLKMAEKAGMPPNRGQLISIRKTASRNAVQAAESILAEADDLGAQLGLQVGSMKKARGITGLNTWGNDAAKEADRLNDLMVKIWKKDTKAATVNFNQLWMAYPELFPGAPPAGLTKDVFMDALFANYDTVVSKVWGGARDTAIESVTSYLDDLKGLGAEIPDTWYDTIKAAQEGAQQYDNAMIGRFGELVEETPMPYGTRSSQISQLASKHGIATATEAGAPLDSKLLKTINKYADTSYKSLEEVPIQVAEEAFAKKVGKVANQPELANATADLEEATKIPRSQLPEKVSTRIADEAKRLLNELTGGEAGKRTAEGSFGSTNVQWYRDLPRNMQDKKTLEKALEKIIADHGKDKGVNNVLKQLGADDETLQEALDAFNDITKQEATLEDAIRQSGGELDFRDPDLPYFDDAGNLVEPRKRILPPPSDGEAPPISRAIYEQMDKVKEMRAWMMDDITKNFGKKQLVDKVTEQALQKAEKELTQKLAETRLISSRVAQANRDFTLLNYGEKSYWDVALAYLYPYNYWYKGTYKNWLSRVATNPAILAHYSRYKENLGTVHADMPEWWRYNINTNDLPGVDVDNPLFFNLEATLWPLNGLTNTDFNDPSKRVNFWTYALDYANKFGPSTWSPINIVTGLSLYAQGEKEAGERWMGRIFPQSTTIKAAGSLLGVANLETDPFVKFLQGGLDPYERRRVGRALAQMEQEGTFTTEQIQDAAYSQEGEIWDEAVKRSVRGRAPSQISSYLFGVGFKGRTVEDQQVDKFYTDYNKLWQMKTNLTPEEFREGMDTLKGKYSFMDTVLLSRRSGVERDAGLAYNVLTRIPPGKTSQIAEAVGIDGALMDKFFADKGQIDKWSKSDYNKFMSGVLNIAAVLEIPSDMKRGEWTKAKNAYTGLTNEAKSKFGGDILDSVDLYYQAKTINSDAANAYLDNHPEVSDYLDWKADRVINSPLLSAYYGGASQIESYYRGQQYKDIEDQLGEEIFDIIDNYNDLKTYDPAEAKRFYSQNKAKIKKYYSLKDDWSVTINQQVAQLAAHLPEGQDAGIREDYDSTSVTAQNLVNSLQPQEQPTYQDFQAMVPDRLMRLVEDYYTQSERLPESAQKQLERVARDMGYSSADDLLQAIGISMYAQP